MGTGAKAAAAPTRERQIAAVFIVKDGGGTNRCIMVATVKASDTHAKNRAELK